MIRVKRAFLLDVDGVISDPVKKRITTSGLAEAIGGRIDKDEVVSLNTGRSISWLIEHDIIGSIERAVKDKSKLADFIAVGEKGGTWFVYEDGQMKTHVDKSISVPPGLQKKVRELIEGEFSDSMFFDESKLTMISTEMIDGFSIPEYTKRQHELLPRLVETISSLKNVELKIDPTIIAADIQNSHVGKHLGAKRIIDFLEKRQIQPEHYITVGDSNSDTEMAEELQEKYSVEFVYVGDEGKLDKSKLTCPVTIPESKHGKGLLEYLQRQDLT